MAPRWAACCRWRRQEHESLPWPWNMTTSWVGVPEGNAYLPDASPSELVKPIPSSDIEASRESECWEHGISAADEIPGMSRRDAAVKTTAAAEYRGRRTVVSLRGLPATSASEGPIPPRTLDRRRKVPFRSTAPETPRGRAEAEGSLAA